MATKQVEIRPNALPSVADQKSSLSAYGTARSTVQGAPLDAELLRKIHAYWRACNYLSLSSRYSSPNANFVRVGGNSRGNFEADGLEQCIQVVSDALI